MLVQRLFASDLLKGRTVFVAGGGSGIVGIASKA